MSLNSVFAPSPDPSGTVNPRRVNRQRLLDAVRRLGPISRADLAKRTRLSPPTVSALVEDLAGDVSLLREIGVGTSKGGRPPIMLAFNAEYGYLVGVDVGSRRLRVALADLQGHVLARHSEPTDTASQGATIEQIFRGIARVFRSAGRDPAKLFALGVGAPGMTDINTGRVINAVNLPGWVDVPLREILQSRLTAPVRVDNDANMAALGERWLGSARQVNDFVFLALGAGVGAGVVIGGRLHRGHHFYAGEISRMNLDFRQWQADFGERGYLESRVGAAAIPEGKQIFDAARAGDAEAAAVIDQLAVYLGTAVANIVSVLDPALVVFGGGLSHAGDFLIDPVRRVVARIVPNVPALEVSSLGDDAQLMGSLSSAMELAEGRLALLLRDASFPTRAARSS